MRRKYLWVVIPFAVIIVVLLYLKFTQAKALEPWFRKQLQGIITEETDSLYRLQVRTIRADITTGYIRVEEASLFVDSARMHRPVDSVHTTVEASIPQLVVRGFGLWEALGWKKVDLASIELDSPTLHIYTNSAHRNDSMPVLYEQIADAVSHFSVRDLAVRQIEISVHDNSGNKPDLYFPDTGIRLHDVLIAPETRDDSSRFFFAKDAHIVVRNFTHSGSDNLYHIQLDSAVVEGARRQFTAHGLTMEPLGGDQAFRDKVDRYQDRYRFLFPHVMFSGVDWFGLFDTRHINIEKAYVRGGEINIHADRTLPPVQKSKVGNYPHQLLMKLKYELEIDSLIVERMRLKYSELSSETMQTGTMTFENSSGVFCHITNIPDRIQSNRYLTVHAQSSLMGSALVYANFRFDLARPREGIFSVDFHLGRMDGTKLNQVSMALSMLELRRLDIREVSGRIDGGNHHATGKVKFLYDSLDIAILKPDPKSTGGLKERRFMTFLAEQVFLVKQNTPADDNIDPKVVQYDRQAERSMFNLIWKTIFTGMEQTMMGKNE